LKIDPFALADASTALVLDENKTPAIPVYVLTEEGRAVATILPNNQEEAFMRFCPVIEGVVSGATVERLKLDPTTSRYMPFPPPAIT
jgi:hypothetical protein